MSKRLWPLMGRSLLGLLAILALMFVVGIGVGYLGAHGVVSLDAATVAAMAVFSIVLMAGAMAFSVGWMRSIDEAAREAHKAAWFWGGCGGMALGGVGVILASLPQAERLAFTAMNGRTDPAAYMATGAFAMILVMTAGYAVVWAYWWLAKR